MPNNANNAATDDNATIPCHIMPCHAMPYHTMPYHTLSYHTMGARTTTTAKKTTQTTGTGECCIPRVMTAIPCPPFVFHMPCFCFPHGCGNVFNALARTRPLTCQPLYCHIGPTTTTVTVTTTTTTATITTTTTQTTITVTTSTDYCALCPCEVFDGGEYCSQ